MIRVLQVVTYMGRGGLETLLMNYYRSIDRSRVQFDFLTHRDFKADYDDEITALGGKIYHLPLLNPFSLNYRKKLDCFFQEHPEYTVVHVHQDCMSSVILKAAEKHQVPVRIAHSHCSSQDKNLKYPVKIFYQRKIPQYATCLLSCGEQAGKWMFRGAAFEILNNAIDTPRYTYNSEKRKEKRLELGIDEDTYLVGHVGRFFPQKNHTFLIDIFSILEKKAESKVKLLLVGDGELRPQIEKKVKALNMESSVVFTGIRNDVADLLQAMDIFVFPSNYEGLPMTLVEAQAAGLPCLISDKVSIECRKTNLVQQIALDFGAEAWADRILEEQKNSSERRNTYEEIRDSGFDIQENARKLQDFYIRAASGDKNLCLY